MLQKMADAQREVIAGKPKMSEEMSEKSGSWQVIS
jgi:hypothetical protein